MTSSTAEPTSWLPEFEALASELKAAFRDWEGDPSPWPEARVDALARRAFRLQAVANRPYALYCERRGVGPEDVEGWRDLPPVPTAAFREVQLCLGPPEEAEAVFLTSGTTRGRARRGRHPIRDLGLYRASLGAAFRRHVLDGREPLRVLSLIPSFREASDSSLSWMADAILRRFGDRGSASVADASGIRWEALEREVARAVDEGRPVCALATTLAADAWMRRWEKSGTRLPLPEGSRLMDTGGAKGRPGLERSQVVAAIGRRLGIPPERVVNEFGMTELLSQRYSRPVRTAAEASETTLEAAAWDSERLDPERPRLHGPPWLRTRALDPVTLEELPEGEAGVLCHLDLANAASVCAVLTEDLGRVRDGVVEWIGRAADAPPRGCSLATAELLAAQRG